DDLGLGVCHLYSVADLLSEQRARQRRHMRERPVRGVGLVLANDAERLAAAVVAHDAHGRAEMHLAAIAGLRGKLRARPPGSPITQVASDPRERRTVLGLVRGGVLLLQARNLGLDARQPPGSYEVGMRRNGPIRQLLNRVLQVFDECSTHDHAFFLIRVLSSRYPPPTPVKPARSLIWAVESGMGTPHGGTRLRCGSEIGGELFQRRKVQFDWVAPIWAIFGSGAERRVISGGYNA